MVSLQPSLVDGSFSILEELLQSGAIRIGYLCPRSMFGLGDDDLQDIGEERYDLRPRVITSDSTTTLAEFYGDGIDRADLLSILCYAGYLCPNMWENFTSYEGNDLGEIEIAMWILGGGTSGISHCEFLLFGYDDIASYLLQWASWLDSRESAVQVLFPYSWARACETYPGWPNPYSIPVPPPSLPLGILSRLARQEHARAALLLPPSSPLGAPSSVGDGEDDRSSLSSPSSSSEDDGFHSCGWDSTSDLLADLAAP